jgi:hypothetical protein
MKKYRSRKNRVAGCGGFVRVYLNTLMPPYLSLGADLHGLVVFLENYEAYAAVGSQAVEMRCCIEGSLLQDMLVREPFDPSNLMELRTALYKHYCPDNHSVASWWLQNEKCPQCDCMKTFSQGSYMRYVRRFRMIMDICRPKLPPTEYCIEILVRNTQPAEISNFLERCCIQGTPYESLMTEIQSAVELFETSWKVMEACRPQQFQSSIANRNHRSRAHVFSVTQPTNVPTTPLTDQPKRTWARDMCLGCGHITNPPHRRHNCPYRECQDWHAHGVPMAPIRIPPVARLIGGGENGCSIHAEACVVTSSNRASAENNNPNRGLARTAPMNHVSMTEKRG